MILEPLYGYVFSGVATVTRVDKGFKVRSYGSAGPAHAQSSKPGVAPNRILATLEFEFGKVAQLVRATVS